MDVLWGIVGYGEDNKFLEAEAIPWDCGLSKQSKSDFKTTMTISKILWLYKCLAAGQGQHTTCFNIV